MTKLKLWLMGSLLGLAASLFSQGLLARSVDHDQALRLRQEGLILSFQELLAKVQKRYPESTLLEAELEESKGIFIYEMEVLTREGVVRELKLNASNGEILADKLDD